MDIATLISIVLSLYLIGQGRLLDFLHYMHLLILSIAQSAIQYILQTEENGTDADLTGNIKDTKSSSSEDVKERLETALVPSAYRAGWVTVNGVESRVLTWGGWVEGPPPDGESLILFMCGVPGITLFYHNFLDTLYRIVRIPIWTISMAGHELRPSSPREGLPDDPRLYNNVKAQVDHKMAFFKSYVPRDRKVYLIGHSFGAKMVSELLKDEQVSGQMQKCVLLMPTLERFKDTPRARFWLTMLQTGIIYPLAMCIWVLSLLPMACRRVLARLYFLSRGLSSVSQCCHDALLQFCQPAVFHNVQTLVRDELDVIQQLDAEILSKHSDRLKVYFASKDQWAPLTHCETLKTAVPDLTVEVLDDKFRHAFTLDTAEDMAVKLFADLVSERY